MCYGEDPLRGIARIMLGVGGWWCGSRAEVEEEAHVAEFGVALLD